MFPSVEIIAESGVLRINEYLGNFWMDVGTLRHTTKEQERQFAESNSFTVEDYIPASGYARYTLKRKQK